MEYSIFPTEHSARKWALENLVPEWSYAVEQVSHSEFWLWYHGSHIKPIPAEWKHLVSDWVQNG